MQTPKWFLNKTPVAYLLLPLSIIYYLISRLVYFIRKIRQKTSKRPVICVGNIFAGGVGKTPIVMQIAKHFNAPVVMRGYKRTQGRKDARTQDSYYMGDEAEMMKAACLDVYVGNRVANIKKLNLRPRALAPLCPIIMDDGFQNPTVKKDISILVFDENLGIGNGFTIPAGPLREPVCAVKRADAVIIIKSKEQRAKSKLHFNKPTFYATNKNTLPAGVKRFIAFAGIGYPQKFFDNLPIRAIKEVAFPDHYQYTKSDIDGLLKLAASNNAQLITTQKDWVRLWAAVQKKIQVAKLETTIEPAFWEWIGGKLK